MHHTQQDPPKKGIDQPFLALVQIKWLIRPQDSREHQQKRSNAWNPQLHMQFTSLFLKSILILPAMNGRFYSNMRFGSKTA